MKKKLYLQPYQIMNYLKIKIINFKVKCKTKDL
jgi:hypothetical protein